MPSLVVVVVVLVSPILTTSLVLAVRRMALAKQLPRQGAALEEVGAAKSQVDWRAAATPATLKIRCQEVGL